MCIQRTIENEGIYKKKLLFTLIKYYFDSSTLFLEIV